MIPLPAAIVQLAAALLVALLVALLNSGRIQNGIASDAHKIAGWPAMGPPVARGFAKLVFRLSF